MLSRSDKTGETAAKPVVSITPAHIRRIWAAKVSYKDEDGRWTEERYETTDNHPWRTADGKWVTSAFLQEGQSISLKSGTAIVVSVVDTETDKLAYNLEVADFHTYFVGQAEAWVHNSCPLNPNQTNHLVQQARAPRGIGRTDIGKIKGEQQHTIIIGVGAINIDGTWRHGGGALTNSQANFLRSNGYNIP